MKPILEIQQIAKRFFIGHEQLPYYNFRDRITSIFKPQTRQEEFWALHDISFDVMPGDSVGIIGRNGAGKSTLLKILSRITPPTKGRIINRGRVASLLEVGTGFHQELTGRENIFMNGSILGMRNQEIKLRFDEIVEFSGVGNFLDTPLKHYSSGMQLRLAFAVAAHLNPEILIIDEVLAVGDAEFQKRCLQKMERVSKEGRTILFVSHNLAAVENLCNTAVLLDKGRVVSKGNVGDVINYYQASFSSGGLNSWTSNGDRMEAAYFKKIEVSLHGEQPHLQIKIQSVITSASMHKDLFVAINISNSIGVTVMQAIPNQLPFLRYSEHDQSLAIEIDLPPLIPDRYSLSLWMGPHNAETICFEMEAVSFEVVNSPMKGWSFPHSHNNGFVIPFSRIL